MCGSLARNEKVKIFPSSSRFLIQVPHVVYWFLFLGSTDDKINSIAVCAGSGASILKGVKADLYITGEMLHHDVLDAVHIGANVILTNHSDSERGFLKVFALRLAKILGDSVKVSVSLVDTDPLKTV